MTRANASSRFQPFKPSNLSRRLISLGLSFCTLRSVVSRKRSFKVQGSMFKVRRQRINRVRRVCRVTRFSLTPDTLAPVV
jgi:hypothetical protein